MKTFKNKNFKSSLKNAINGIIYMIKFEKNFAYQIFYAFYAIFLGMIFKLDKSSWLILMITIFLVLSAEMINTSIEKAIDLYSEEKYFKLAKISKDVAAGSVLLLSINSLIIGYILFFDKFMLLKNNFLKVILILILLLITFTFFLNKFLKKKKVPTATLR